MVRFRNFDIQPELRKATHGSSWFGVLGWLNDVVVRVDLAGDVVSLVIVAVVQIVKAHDGTRVTIVVGDLKQNHHAQLVSRGSSLGKRLYSQIHGPMKPSRRF